MSYYIGQQKHNYIGTAKELILKICKDYELVEYIEKPIIEEKMSPYVTTQRIKQASNNTNGTSISERPESIESREEYGHWEMDTVVSGKGQRFICCC